MPPKPISSGFFGRLAMLLQGCLISVVFSGSAYAYTSQEPVTPSAAAGYCSDENSDPWAPGSQAVTPGLWARPGNVGGSSWDLVWSDDRKSLKAIIYTYESNGRPTWLVSKMKALEADGTSWKSTLYRFTAPGNSSTAVGSVAFRFFPEDPTRLVASWDWNSLAGRQQKECLGNFISVSPTFSDLPNTPETISDPDAVSSTGQDPDAASDQIVNELFNGLWNTVGSTGQDNVPGISINILRSTFPASGNAPGIFQEHDLLLTFDSTGAPVYLIADMDSPTRANQQISTTNSGKLLYRQWTHGIPLDTCAVASCGITTEVGSISRQIRTTGAGTTATIKVSDLRNPPSDVLEGGQQNIKGANFFPAENSDVTVRKIISNTGIRPVQYSCKVGAGQTTCPIRLLRNARAARQ